ncbi:MAG: methionyl-tRNA formyltransferase [Vicinamibacterales bacterium]
MVTSLRVLFFGTPAFAVPTLQQLLRSSHQVVAVVTQPDRPRGRGHKLVFSPVKEQAIAAGVPVLQPERMKDDALLATIEGLRADLGVVAAYGRILPQRLLDLPRLGMINVHASLLPRWRGAAPIHRAVLAGDEQTGVTIMRVVLALDAGPMLAKTAITIGPDETTAELEPRLADAGARLFREVVDQLAAGPVDEEPQDEALATYAARLERRESDIDWGRPAHVVHNQIRGLQPWPLAAARLQGHRVLLLRSRVADRVDAAATPGTIVEVSQEGLLVATQPGGIFLQRIQPEGRPPMSVRDFLNGRPVAAGEAFTPLAPEA